MATIIPHPAVLHNPQALAAVQAETGLLVTLHISPRRTRVRLEPSETPAQRPAAQTRSTGPVRPLPAFPAAWGGTDGDLPPCA